MSSIDLPLLQVDTTGLMCPEPLMMVHQAVRRAQPAQTLEVRATDPSTTRDIPKFCMHLGHELLEQRQQHEAGQLVYVFLIRKKYV
jgi:tRNA 2-thiouridine synthesizing protein A